MWEIQNITLVYYESIWLWWYSVAATVKPAGLTHASLRSSSKMVISRGNAFLAALIMLMYRFTACLQLYYSLNQVSGGANQLALMLPANQYHHHYLVELLVTVIGTFKTKKPRLWISGISVPLSTNVAPVHRLCCWILGKLEVLTPPQFRDAQYFAVGFFKQQLEHKTCPVLPAVNEIFGCLIPGNNVCSWIFLYGFSTFRQATWAQISLDLDEICSMQT